VTRKCFPTIKKTETANTKQLKHWSVILPNPQTEDEHLIVNSIKRRLKKGKKSDFKNNISNAYRE
jgi:hypothetical protein